MEPSTGKSQEERGDVIWRGAVGMRSGVSAVAAVGPSALDPPAPRAQRQPRRSCGARRTPPFFVREDPATRDPAMRWMVPCAARGAGIRWALTLSHPELSRFSERCVIQNNE